MLNQYKQVGGEPVHIRDCYVWAEIRYLDSATDYRECLPQNPLHPRTVSGNDLVMLDDSSAWSMSNLQRGWPIAGLCLIIAGLFLCVMLHLLA
jgi:hypothetical protein